MNWSPNSILYTCIAKDNTILADFNSTDGDHTDLAKKCLDRTPEFHSVFSHTVLGKMYMFFINDPFVYFGIFDESLQKQNCLLFLKTVHDVFTGTIGKLSSGTMNPTSHSLQGEFGPVIQQLVGSNSELSCLAGSKDEPQEDKGDGLSDDDVSSECKCVWDKQVMVVLSMDLVVCAGLFVIWLWVCDGFRCVAD